MADSFGSYYSLEISKRNSEIYHSNAIWLNTGRNAFEYILKAKDVSKIYLPYFSCDALLTPLKKLNICYEYYCVDELLFPLFDYECIKHKEYFLYINYFGLKSDVAQFLQGKVANLIVDNTQAFFSKPLVNVPTFYSTRKFFGVPDGALLCNVSEKIPLTKDKSAERFAHLLLRHENESDVGYGEYLKVEQQLNDTPLMAMSNLTSRLMKSIDFEYHKKSRNENFRYLEKNFGSINRFKYLFNEAPLVYPLWVKNGVGIKKELLKERVYLPTYWPNVLGILSANEIEVDLVNNILPIPIDSRYSRATLNRVCKLISSYF